MTYPYTFPQINESHEIDIKIKRRIAKNKEARKNKSKTRNNTKIFINSIFSKSHFHIEHVSRNGRLRSPVPVIDLVVPELCEPRKGSVRGAGIVGNSWESPHLDGLSTRGVAAPGKVPVV